MSYAEFISGKHRVSTDNGIDTKGMEVNANAFGFQAACIDWAWRKGDAALFAGCGLGKSLMMLEWCSGLIRRGHAKRALIQCPVAVAPQMVSEAAKFNIQTECRVVASSADVKSGINITNYEKLHKFDTSAFDIVSLDEASILKNYTGATKRKLCDAFRSTRFKLASTATPAPNDHMELGNQAEFLGVMRSNEMLSRWFINDTMKAGGYRLAGHAASDFWNWMSSWAMSISMPSDIGFPDEGYILPELHMREHIVESGVPSGHLFAIGREVSATTVHQEKRASLEQKVALVRNLVDSNSGQWCLWCDTNYEADALLKAIPSAVEVRGSHSDEVKAERLMSFVNGNDRVLISKPEIAGFGLNMQGCHQTTYFAGFSFERWYQSIRRFYRFGQVNPVWCHMIASENEAGVVRAMKAKQAAADEMSREMTRAMRDGMISSIHGSRSLRSSSDKQLHVANWLQSKG